MDTNYIIETKNLTKQYGSQKSVADLNIHVKRGRIYGLLGRNGAGKTTTMKMLLGLTKPTSGEVKIWGKSLQGNEKKLLPRIGSLIESPGFYPNLTGTENLRIFATLRGVPNNHAIKDALNLVGLPYKDKKLFSQYSLGMKQRLAIALAVMHDPELLILDEPTGGLDPLMQRDFFEIIRERSSQGTTVFLSSHILSEVQHNCSRAAIIREGRIIACDSVDTLAKTNAKRVSLRGTVDLTDLTGIRDQVTVDGITSFLFGGDINQLLRQLSDGNILDIHISEPDLEEIFLHYYEKDGDRV